MSVYLFSLLYFIFVPSEDPKWLTKMLLSQTRKRCKRHPGLIMDPLGQLIQGYK